MNPTETKLIHLIEQEYGLEPGRIGRASRLAELGDSLEWTSLLLAVEDAFDVLIDMEQSLALATVADLLRLVEETVPA